MCIRDSAKDPIAYPLEDGVNSYNPYVQQFDAFEKGQLEICLLYTSKCFIAVMIGTYSPNARSSVEPEMPGSTIADMASAPLTKTYRADGTSNASVETEKCSRLRATTTAAPAKKKSICPVSYTHLDVYKRQQKSLPRAIMPLENRKSNRPIRIANAATKTRTITVFFLTSRFGDHTTFLSSLLMLR